MVGVMLFLLYRAHPMPIPIPEVRPGSGIKANDYIYPIFMMTGVPHVLRGFLVVAILSAAMSSVSSALTALASVSTMDFVKPFTGRTKSEEWHLKFSKYSTVFWAGALILVASLSREVEYVLNAAFSLRGLTSGALLGGLALVLFWRKGHWLPIFAGMIGSFLAMIFISRHEWTVDGETAKIAWPWFTLIGTSITIGLASLTRLFLPAHPNSGGTPAAA
jgi:Na+/proline symporter